MPVQKSITPHVRNLEMFRSHEMLIKETGLTGSLIEHG